MFVSSATPTLAAVSKPKLRVTAKPESPSTPKPMQIAVVVSSDHQTGGTWAGAVEALKGGWCPVLVRDGDGVPRGNKELLKLGAIALPAGELPKISNLAEWVQQHAPANTTESELFDFALRDKPR